jgi:uncharacterized protein YceK
MRGKSLALALLAPLLANGCGTVGNFASGRPEPYGGVARDIEFARERGDKPLLGSNPEGAAVLLALCAGELCASAVADTLTLPLIACRERKAWNPDPLNDEAPPDPPPQYSAGAVADSSIR